MRTTFQFLIFTGWLLPVGAAVVFFRRWIAEIVVPPLKGANFEPLYDLHQLRYPDPTLACTVVAFVWVSFAVCRWARRQIDAS